ncbi:MAG TPA: energy transducer TonB [Kofleriaceae bacterium]|nr:energy transducer TonB [Kofleriaceae bacterium]
MKALGLTLVAVAALGFAGCAATAQPERSTEPHLAQVAFPKRISGGEDLLTVRRLNRAIETRHEGQVSARVRVCVSPDGQVALAELVSSSGLEDYDRELLSDVRSWSYQPYAAPAGTRVCERLEVSYQAG